MIKNVLLLNLLFFVCGFMNVAVAQVPIAAPAPAPTTREQQAFISLNWYLGESKVPELAIGYRDVTIDSSNDVSGQSISVSYNFESRKINKVELVGMAGDVNKVGKLNLGYSFINQKWLAGLGVQGNNLSFSANYLFNEEVEYLLGFNTIDD